MNHRSLHRDVTLFREGMLSGDEPNSMCYMVSSALAGYLVFMGTPCRMVEGYVHENHHWWIELTNEKDATITVIDATADQFTRPNGRKMPKVYVGPRPDWYMPI